MIINNKSIVSDNITSDRWTRVIGDGENVLRHPCLEKRNWDNIRALEIWAQEEEISVILFLPNYRKLRKEYDDENIQLTPFWGNPQIKGDTEMLLFSEANKCLIVSNDRFSEYKSRFSDIIMNDIVRFNIYQGTFLCDLKLTRNHQLDNVVGSKDRKRNNKRIKRPSSIVQALNKGELN
jgi:hypothetical protein